METILESQTPEEIFGFGHYHSNYQNTGIQKKTNVIGYIIVGLIIGGVIVYIFRYDIEAFFNGLSGKSPDESE